MKKWNLVIDIAKCFNCNCCALACHDEYHGNEFPGYAAEMPRLGHRWIDIKQRETGKQPMVDVNYLPVMCNHCDDAPCMKVAKNGAVTKRPDGIVLIDPEKSKGQKRIVDACPYKAVFWNEEKQIPQAWPFDAHLLDQGWTRTRGSQVCPTQAMQTLHVTDEEMQDIVQRDKLEVLQPELGTKPRVYYRNLSRFSAVFIGGALTKDVAGTHDCAAGVRVVLSKGGQAIGEQVTDTFGEFRFRNIGANSGKYTLSVPQAKFTLDVDVKKDSVCLGAIALPKAAAVINN